MKMPKEGEHVTTELFYMRVSRLRFRRTWVDERAFMRGQFFLTALSAVMLLLAGFVMGLSASEYRHGGSVSWRDQQQQIYMGEGLVVSSSVDGDVGNICDCNVGTALGAVGNTTLLS